MIVASAIKLIDGKDRVFVGKRHGDCFMNIVKLHMKTGMSADEAKKLHFNCIQGFINDSLEFLTREEAYYEAFDCGQCKEQHYVENRILDFNITAENWKPCLFSEDLW